MTAPIDVVVPVYRDVERTRACLESVLRESGARLGRLIVVDDRGPEPEMAPMLAALRHADARVRLLVNEQNLGFVGASNRGLALRQGDVVVLNSDTLVTPGWLDELAAALEDPRVAAACPLSNNATLCSVPRWGEASPERELSAGLRTSAQPRFTPMPTGVGFCMLMRGSALELLGAFDPKYGRGYNEENDWCQRARAAGFTVVRANHALVLHRGEVSFQGERATRDVINARRLIARYPDYLAENAAFERSLDAHLPAIAQRAETGPVRVVVEASGLVPAREPEEALAARWLLDELTRARGVQRVELEGRGSAELTHVLGLPSLETVEALLARDTHLVHSHFDLSLLEGGPGAPPTPELARLRAAAFALWSSATVLVRDGGAAQRVEALLGGPPASLLLAAPLPPPGRTSAGATTWLALGRGFSRALVIRLLEAWQRHGPPGAELVIGPDAGPLPEPLSGLPGVGFVRLDDAAARVSAICAARALLIPPAPFADGPDAHLARAAGIPVIVVDADPVRSAPWQGATTVASPPPAAPIDWRSVYLRAIAGAGAGATRRRRLQELFGALCAR